MAPLRLSSGPPMAQGDPTLRVPTQVVRVEVAFGSAAPRTVDLFAPAGEPGRPDRARVAELLSRDQRFLPARDVETGALVTLGARAICWLSVPLARSAELLVDDDLFEHRRDVEIELDGGAALAGELLYSAPAASTRVVDVLNAEGRFVPLWLTDRVVFVNKSLVRGVTEVPHAHRPTVFVEAAKKAPKPKPVGRGLAPRQKKKAGR